MMKSILIYAFLATVVSFNFVESIPSTLCITNLCETASSGRSSCKLIGIIEIRNTYSGRVDLKRDGRTCSIDGVFCVDVVGDTGDLFVQYRNVNHYINHSVGARRSGTWCAYWNGVEYWMEL